MNISGVWIPIVAMLIPIVAIISGSISEMHKRRMEMEQRMALIARGVPLAEIDGLMKTPVNELTGGAKDPMRSLANSRRAAVVLISVGVGLALFFLIFGAMALKHIDHDAGWVLLACTGTGLIPLAIGVGFAIDYRLQRRELTRFGLEVGADRG